MAQQKKTTYALLTPEHRFQMLEEIRARRARIAAGLPPDSPEPEEEEEEEEEEGEQQPEAEQQPVPMEVADLEEDDEAEPEEEDAAEPAPVAGFAMEDAMAEYEAAQAAEMAEQTAIFKSIQDEVTVKANRRFIRQQQTETDALFSELKTEEEAET